MLTDPIRDVETDEKVRLALCSNFYTAEGIVILEGFVSLGRELAVDLIGVRPQVMSPTGKRYAY